MKKNILILGGGFAGLEAAIYLRKEKFDVTLISNRDYLYIYPTSIWIPTGEITFKDTSMDLKILANIHGFNLIIDEVEAIISNKNQVICKNYTYNYKFLVVAIGSGKVQHQGNEHFLSICGNPEESLQIKAKIDKLISKGSGKIAIGFGGNPKDLSNVRGGPAFELLFNLHNKLNKLNIRENFELTFFAPMKEPGARMGKKALKMLDVYFKKFNINTHFGKKIKYFKENGIIFEDDSILESDFTMFIAAGSGHSVFKKSDLPLNEAGLIQINDYCEVNSNIYAIGDCIAIQGPSWVTKQGHIAEIMAKNVAFNIKNKIQQTDSKKGYKKHLNILCIMDSGDGAILIYRDTKGSKIIPMPIIGHWLKKGWGWYYRNSKLNKIPRIPGM